MAIPIEHETLDEWISVGDLGRDRSATAHRLCVKCETGISNHGPAAEKGRKRGRKV